MNRSPPTRARRSQAPPSSIDARRPRGPGRTPPAQPHAAPPQRPCERERQHHSRDRRDRRPVERQRTGGSARMARHKEIASQASTYASRAQLRSGRAQLSVHRIQRATGLRRRAGARGHPRRRPAVGAARWSAAAQNPRRHRLALQQQARLHRLRGRPAPCEGVDGAQRGAAKPFEAFHADAAAPEMGDPAADVVRAGPVLRTPGPARPERRSRSGRPVRPRRVGRRGVRAARARSARRGRCRPRW